MNRGICVSEKEAVTVLTVSSPRRRSKQPTIGAHGAPIVATSDLGACASSRYRYTNFLPQVSCSLRLVTHPSPLLSKILHHPGIRFISVNGEGEIPAVRRGNWIVHCFPLTHPPLPEYLAVAIQARIKNRKV